MHRKLVGAPRLRMHTVNKTFASVLQYAIACHDTSSCCKTNL